MPHHLHLCLKARFLPKVAWRPLPFGYLNFLNREKIIASNKLAIDIQSNLLSAVRSKFKVVDGGVREAPFWVLVGALMPAVLIETGYITHTHDHKLLSNKSYTDKIALGIADGIDDYFTKNQ